ncbi:MAG TPA: PhoU domain-containing protein, partial [Anaerolineaceae bacterium]|nr:PhoU domain-containing protein [Anaerolineaceae bacterium]
LTAILEIITELERIGDYAKGIAKVTHRLGDHEVPMPAHEFEQMSEIAVGMLHRALGAFINENPNEAVVISQEDDQVDSLYERAYRSIVEAMIANPATIDQSNLLLWVAHNLERTADRVTNICERTVFISTGELLEMDSTDDELDTEEID